MNFLAYLIQDLLCAAAICLGFLALVTVAGFVAGSAPQTFPAYVLYGLFAISVIGGFHLWGWLDSIRKSTFE